MTSDKVSYQIMDAPVGRLLIAAQKEYLIKSWFLSDNKPYRLPAHYEPDNNSEVLALTKWQLTEYFEGVRTEFQLPLFFKGTDFNTSIWKQLIRISYGETISYMDVAKRINNPGAVRAVGLASNRNPVAIICPCHRVIGSGGKLVGFGGGLRKKEWLLHHEDRYSGKEHQLRLFEH